MVNRGIFGGPCFQTNPRERYVWKCGICPQFIAMKKWNTKENYDKTTGCTWGTQFSIKPFWWRSHPHSHVSKDRVYMGLPTLVAFNKDDIGILVWLTTGWNEVPCWQITHFYCWSSAFVVVKMSQNLHICCFHSNLLGDVLIFID